MAKKKKVEIEEPLVAPSSGRKAVDIAMKRIRKKFGDEVVSWVSEVQTKKRGIISTSSLAIDAALGVGGVARGRIYELYGPNASGKTTLALLIIKEAIKQGHRAVFIDAEHTLDKGLLEAMDIDPDKIVITRGYTGEDNLDIAESLMATGEFAVCVIDSISALQPAAEANLESFSDNTMGLQPRLMSRMCRTFTSLASRTDTALLLINQIRANIGGYGCLHADTPITLADKTQMSIRDIVETRHPGPVVSYCKDSGKFEYKKITGWHNNGKVDAGDSAGWLTVNLGSVGGRGGNMSFTGTPNHNVFVQEEGAVKEISLKSLRPGMSMVSWYDKTITEGSDLYSIIAGSLLGDGKIAIRSKATGCLSLANSEQPEYLNWKLESLAALDFTKVQGASRTRFDSSFTPEMSVLKSSFYRHGVRTFPSGLQLTPLMAAVWFMDDGNHKHTHRNATISCKRWFTSKMADVQEEARSMLVKFIGCQNDQVVIREGTLAIHTSAFSVFSAKIAPNVPESMSYKLLPEDRHRCCSGPITCVPAFPEKQVRLSVVKNISPASDRKYRDCNKYDITVDGNENYLVGGASRGVLVHNSPETTSGGNAIQHHVTGRIRVIGGGTKSRQIKDAKGNVIGHRCGIEITKNKLSAPFRSAEVELIYGVGFNTTGEILDLGVDMGLIDQKGAYFSVNGENIGQGRVKAIKSIDADSKLRDTLLRQIKEVLGIDAPTTDVATQEGDGEQTM